MNKKNVLYAIGLMAALGAGCDDDDGGDRSDEVVRDAGRDASGDTDIDASVRPDGSLDAASDSSADAAVALSEGQVVGIAAAINTGEISAGTLASTKATAAGVKAYAAEMVTVHTAANDRATALGIAPATSAQQVAVQNQAMTALTQLQSTAAGAEFDRLYVESQVQLHQSALTAFDQLLLPNAKTPALVAELQQVRGLVVQHLEHAQSLRSDSGT